MNNSLYGVVFLLRKTGLTLAEIRKLKLDQFNELVKEVMFQESVKDYQTALYVANLMATIVNTIPRRSGSKTYEASDFMAAKEPHRPGEAVKADPKAELEALAERFKIKLPAKEIREL